VVEGKRNMPVQAVATRINQSKDIGGKIVPAQSPRKLAGRKSKDKGKR